ncbi:MAG: hypothetical protein CFE23_16410 [Flavobacterium sp. BFFFF1]|uniref:hypothetical protein n=1 Tax=Flavobacterium sp. BFFFF1 TaxID=2015557 RepID=UPI000BC93108|nr:hypothetical protein [Flavobacterium sp. BFFFF1]OYU78924.1 MAG: hypothetical protein CFE23_16410 [Flavobacterium sp. BFFFF1]
MKKTLLTLLFCSILSFGQTTTKSKAHDKKIDTVTYLNSKSDFDFDKIKYENAVLKERLEQASDTINNQNSMVSGFSVIYTIITIIIALLGISLPILTYFFGIRPSQKALIEFEKNIDSKMAEYLEESRNKQIDQAIENLSEADQELVINAINFLSITNHQGFKENQIFKLFHVLKESNLDDPKKMVIANLLSSKKNIYATEYFKSVLQLKNNFKSAAIKYFANNGLSENVNLFRDSLKETSDQNKEFHMILYYCSGTNINAVIFLLNDKEFIDIIDSDFANIIKTNIQHGISSFAQSYGLTENQLKDTYLFKKFSNASS